MRSLIFHIDVNSAFLSWESARRLRENPDAQDLRMINAVIGGDEKMRHGVVLAKSPSAKKYGIMTGEPLSHARQKCPDLVVIPPDHELYAASSRKFIHILEEVAPAIEQCSIDEAFCDMTGTEKLYGDPVAFAEKLKDRIYAELGFTVNIGISTNKLLAKMASDFEKPNRSDFYSHAPRGARPHNVATYLDNVRFQSTRPSRGATANVHKNHVHICANTQKKYVFLSNTVCQSA